ncbi:MAG: dUTP diphosphatase [Rhodobacter sp.]|nr:dUTP diphosphatase [Rhodobacter sp.]MCY4169598.1 dUTP diphosphatase [Rhodobacter sp.]MCY4243709.1 dUTP diphosphatase [Rhodobacter sp.]
MTTPVIRLAWHEEADNTIPLPQYATDGAAGADIRANLPPAIRTHGITLERMERRIVPTGLRMVIPFGYEVQLRPRSGLALDQGITLCNSPGTIDSDYRGPVGVLLVNLGDRPYSIGHGDRIAQLIVAPVARAAFAVSDLRSPTVRDAGGFGSTGLR